MIESYETIESLINFAFIFIAFIFGACFGSFLNVLIIRIPLNRSVIAPQSACMNCGNPLRFYHNIPILSYIFLRGKCAFCGEKISPIYPIIEAISALFGICLYLRFGFSFEFAFFGVAILLLFALSIMDFRFREVPDCLNFAALVFALLGGFVFHREFLFVVGSAFSFAGFFTLLRFALQTFLNKEALGEGDIITVATLAAILGWKVAFVAVFLSAIFALIVLLFLGRDYKIPYIPFLLAGLLVCVFGYDFISAFLENHIFPF